MKPWAHHTHLIKTISPTSELSGGCSVHPTLGHPTIALPLLSAHWTGPRHLGIDTTHYSQDLSKDPALRSQSMLFFPLLFRCFIKGSVFPSPSCATVGSCITNYYLGGHAPGKGKKGGGVRVIPFFALPFTAMEVSGFNRWSDFRMSLYPLIDTPLSHKILSLSLLGLISSLPPFQLALWALVT